MLPKEFRPKEKARLMTQAEYDEFRRRVETGELKAVSVHPSGEDMCYFASFVEPFDPVLSMDEIRKADKDVSVLEV